MIAGTESTASDSSSECVSFYTMTLCMIGDKPGKERSSPYRIAEHERRVQHLAIQSVC